MPLEYTFAAFGIAAAFIIFGGGMILRYHVDRYHFLLMQAALDKGITTFPGTPPAWLVSMRVGVLCLVLGLGLVLGGALFDHLPDTLPASVSAVSSNVPLPPGYPNPAARGAAQPAAPDDNPPPPPPVPPARDGHQPAPPPPRPPANPEMERWHRIENRRDISLTAMAAGLIVGLLGIVRIAFARLERRYTTEPPHTA